jgi:hypothetical protein
MLLAQCARTPRSQRLRTRRIAADTQVMDPPRPVTEPSVSGGDESAQAVLAEVTCTWGEPATDAASDRATAVIVHAGRDVLVLEAADPLRTLPPLGTLVNVTGPTQQTTGRLAEQGRAGRFLLSIGSRPVRRALRLRVTLPGTLRSPNLAQSVMVEIMDLTTGGARVRGIELPVGSQVTLEFTPPGRTESVTVRASVAHGTQGAAKPWIGVAFRLVAMRGGR